MNQMKRALPVVSALAAATLLAACAGVEFKNRQGVEELARQARPPGSVYSGWRVFQDKCASCHGTGAQGTALAPDLLPRVREMGQRRFVGLVLTRYDWSLPPGQARSEAMVDEVLQRRQGTLAMPAWQGEPAVSAHIVDLHAYLTARAEGSQGPGQPSR